MRQRILQGPILKTMLVLAWPVILANALHSLYNLIDAFWLGKLSTEALSAPTVAWPVVFFFMALAIGFRAAGIALVAQYTGAGDEQGADLTGTQVFSFLLLLSAAVGLLGWGLAPHILRLMGTPEAVFPLSVDYLRIVSLGLPAMYASFAFTGLFMGVGDTRTPMLLMGASIVANAVLDPLLIFGWGPLPRLEVAGAAYATVASRGLAAVAGILLLASGRAPVRLRARYLLPRWEPVRKIVSVGAPNVLDQAGTSLGFVMVMGLVAGFGSTVVAAFGVGNRLINLFNVAVWGAVTALLTMVGQNLGADQTKRAEEIARRGIRSTVGVLAGLALLVFLLREPLYRVFIAEPEVVAEGSRFLAIFAFSVPFFGLFAAASSVFRGAGHTVPPMVFSLLRLWGLRIFLAWLLAYQLSLGPLGLWLGMALSNLLAGVAIYAWLRRGTWRRKVIEPESEKVSTAAS
ncbi:MAG: MATE family efflux transporter [Candidatus Bipolaricaulaceae bacterium]